MNKMRELFGDLRFILFLFGLSFIVLLYIGYNYYSSSIENVTLEKKNQLVTISELIIGQFDGFLNDKILVAKSKLQTPAFRPLINEFISSRTIESKSEFQKMLNNYFDLHLYEDILLVNANDSILFSFDANSSYDSIDYSIKDFYSESKPISEYTTVLYQYKSQVEPNFDIIFPIEHNGLKSEYFVVFRISTKNNLLKMVKYWALNNKSATTFIFHKDGDRIVAFSSTYQKDTLMHLSQIDIKQQNIPILKAISGDYGIHEGEDYRSVEVIAYTAKIPNTDWYVLSRIDKDEIYYDIKFRSIVLTTSIILLFFLLMFIFLNIHQVNKKRYVLNQYENELQISESRHIFQTTIYSLSDGIIITNVDGNILNVNPNAEKIIGIDESKAKGKKIEEICEFDFANKSEDESDIQLINNDGNIRYITSKKNDIINNDKNLIGQVIVITDITKEVIHNNIIRESENKFKSIFNGSSQSIILINIETSDIFLVNDTTCSKFGYAIDELMKMNLYDLHPISEKIEIDRFLSELSNSNNVYLESFPCKNKDGGIFYSSINSGFVDISGKQYAIGFYNDVSDKVKSDQILKENIIRFTQVSENSNELIWEINTEGLYTYINSVSEKMLGYKPNELIGKKYFFEMHPVDERDEYINIALKIAEKEEVFRNFENEMIRSDGSTIVVLSSGGPYYDVNGNLLGYRGSDTDITEQKRTEESLKLSEERFRNISNCISDISYSFVEQNGDFRLDWMIGASGKITGYDLDELIKMKSWGNIVHPEDFPIFESHIQNLLPGENSTCKLRLKHKDGSIVWVESFAQCSTKLGNDNCKILYGALLDVTEAKKSEELLEKERTFFEQLFKNSPEGIVLLDNEDRILSCNLEFSNIFGYDIEEISGKYINDIIVPENMRIEGQTLTNLVTDGKEIALETKRLTKSGKLIDVSILGKPIIHKDGEQLAVYGIYRDISDKKESEAALIRSEEKSRAIIEAIPDMFFIITNEGLFVDCLANDDRLLYQPKDLFINKYIYEVLPENISDEFFKSLEKLDSSNTIQKYEYEMVINDSSNWFENRLTRINQGLILVISRDITERKKAEVELLKAKEKAEQSDRLKTSFMANMSHELRTPMSGIMGFTHLLGESDITPQERNEYLALLNRSNKRLLNLINDILDLIRIESGEVEIIEAPMNVNHLISDVYQIHCHNAIAKNIEINLKLPESDDKAIILSDEQKHSQILNNLLSNAIKFTSTGSVVIGYKFIDKNIEFYVEDSGIGIAEEFLPYLFDRFRQEDISFNRSYEGAGLGLSIVKGLIELIGGTISVNSKKHSGTRISYTIPIKMNAVNETDVNDEDTTEDSEDKVLTTKIKKILVAEDDEVNFLYIKNTLKKIDDVSIVYAENGKVAVDLYKANPDILLVFMDIKMPIMDGMAAIEQILNINNEAKIVAITAYAKESDKVDAIKAGCIDYISKPFLPEQLIDAVAKYVD